MTIREVEEEVKRRRDLCKEQYKYLNRNRIGAVYDKKRTNGYGVSNVDDDLLRREYVDLGKSARSIAIEHGWSWQTVRRHLMRMGVYRHASNWSGQPEYDVRRSYRLYEDNVAKAKELDNDDNRKELLLKGKADSGLYLNYMLKLYRISADELAIALGVSRVTLNKWTNGGVEISINFMLQLMALIGIAPAEWAAHSESVRRAFENASLNAIDDRVALTPQEAFEKVKYLREINEDTYVKLHRYAVDVNDGDNFTSPKVDEAIKRINKHNKLAEYTKVQLENQDLDKYIAFDYVMKGMKRRELAEKYRISREEVSHSLYRSGLTKGYYSRRNDKLEKIQSGHDEMEDKIENLEVLRAQEYKEYKKNVNEALIKNTQSTRDSLIAQGLSDLGPMINLRLAEMQLDSTELSEAVGVKYITLYHWRRGSRKPVLDKLLLLMMYLDINPITWAEESLTVREILRGKEGRE